MVDDVNVSVLAEDGGVLVRDSLVAAFFSMRPFAELAKLFGQTLEDWIQRSPDEAKKWICVGAQSEEYKPLTPKLLARGREELDPKRAAMRKLSCLEVMGPQKVNADYRFFFLGSRELSGDKTNMIELRFPSREANADVVEGLVAFLRQVAERLPYDSGYASPALTMGADSQQSAFAQTVRKWAFRHPGFDVASNDATRHALGTKLRGPYWLTFVGPTAVAALGGAASLGKKLPKDVAVQKVGDGLMLRASQLPEVGDVNRLDNLPTLRAMAKVLKPVTLLDDNFLDLNFVDEESRARWERRHLD